MKSFKKILLSFILIAFSFPVMAQVTIGALGGLNFVKLNGDAPKQGYYSTNIGLNAGLMVDIALSKAIKLSLQPAFSQEGTKVLFSQGQYVDLIDSIQLRLNYFSLPLLLKVQSASKHFYAVGGIEAGFLLNYKLTSNGQELTNMLSIADFNISAHFGAGYRIFLGRPALFIELRYTQGLINLTDEPIDTSYIPRVKTSGLKAFIGIEFPLSKQCKK